MKKYQSKVSIYRNELLKRLTPSEVRFKEMLDRHGINYVMQKGFCTKGMSCIVDFYIPSSKCCIEIDGAYHKEKKQKEYDEGRDHYLTKIRNFKLIRVDNELIGQYFPDIMSAMKTIKRGEVVLFSN